MKRLIAMLSLLVLSLDVLAGGCPAAPAKIEKAIQQHMITLRATEYCEARTVKTEHGITVAIYTAEGACAGQDPQAQPGTCSNNWVRYMVVRANQKITPPVEVGGKGGMTDTGVRISSGTIEVKGRSLGPKDSMCCPSVPETKTFKISPSGRVHQVLPVTARPNAAK